MSTEPHVLRIFISYASEDVEIATALARSLRDALGDAAFAEINIDRWFLEAGEEFKKQIKSALERTNVFISLYTGVTKQWSAWEVGFFEGVVMKDDTRQRRLVPMFLDVVPPTTSAYEGIGLGVSASQLQLTPEEFERHHLEINEDDLLSKFFAKMQEAVDECRQAGGFPKAQRRPEQDPVRCVKLLKLAIFNYLKTTIQETIRPQKQLQIRTSGAALQKSDVDLPHEALLIPAGQGNALSSIFGLSDSERTWESFLTETAGSEHAESWRAAIASVVTSSFPNRINVDNSQIVLSNDNATAYRVIITSTIRYYDDKREMNLYFVEALRRNDYGDEKTTLLLRALELSCRFRFMFFETSSPFAGLTIRLTALDTLPLLVTRLLKELNLLRKDARESGFDHVSQWLKVVDSGEFADTVEAYQPNERHIRERAARVLEAKGDLDALTKSRAELADALITLQKSVEPGNTKLIQEMTRRLQIATARPTVASPPHDTQPVDTAASMGLPPTEPTLTQ
jgi:hypothetical protein